MHIYRNCNKTEEYLRVQLEASYTAYQNGTL